MLLKGAVTVTGSVVGAITLNPIVIACVIIIYDINIMKTKKPVLNMVMGKKNMFHSNHISTLLTEEEIIKLKKLYMHYHRLYKCYYWKYKKLKRLYLTLTLSSIGLTVVGTISGTITLNPIVMAGVAGPGVMIQGYLTKSNLRQKITKCHFAYTSYKKILVQLRNFLSGSTYDENIFLSDNKVIDELIIDQCPIIDAYFVKYDKLFLVE